MSSTTMPSITALGLTYGNFRDLHALRAALVRDQGYLCAYCMQRITNTPESMKIEHWYPQNPSPTPNRGPRPNVSPRGPLDFHNLLGVCTGGEGQPRAKQHCDTRKGNRLLSLDPLAHPERHLRYRADGSVLATDATLQAEVNDILNLNLDRLKHNRKSAWDGVYAALKRGGNAAFRPSALRKELDRLDQKDTNGRRREYCGYLTFFIEKKLRRAEAQNRG